jgi:hypothetical protein
MLLPGGDAPEQVVFKALKARKWRDLWTRIGRDDSMVIEECSNAMTLADHHEWVKVAAKNLRCSGETLWQAMCAEWAKNAPDSEVAPIVRAVEDVVG